MWSQRPTDCSRENLLIYFLVFTQLLLLSSKYHVSPSSTWTTRRERGRERASITLVLSVCACVSPFQVPPELKQEVKKKFAFKPFGNKVFEILHILYIIYIVQLLFSSERKLSSLSSTSTIQQLSSAVTSATDCSVVFLHQ